MAERAEWIRREKWFGSDAQLGVSGNSHPSRACAQLGDVFGGVGQGADGAQLGGAGLEGEKPRMWCWCWQGWSAEER